LGKSIVINGRRTWLKWYGDNSRAQTLGPFHAGHPSLGTFVLCWP
jgi:hypothetical protein